MAGNKRVTALPSPFGKLLPESEAVSSAPLFFMFSPSSSLPTRIILPAISDVKPRRCSNSASFHFQEPSDPSSTRPATLAWAISCAISCAKTKRHRTAHRKTICSPAIETNPGNYDRRSSRHSDPDTMNCLPGPKPGPASCDICHQVNLSMGACPASATHRRHFAQTFMAQSE